MLRLSGVSTIIRTPGAEPWSKFSIEWLLLNVQLKFASFINISGISTRDHIITQPGPLLDKPL